MKARIFSLACVLLLFSFAHAQVVMPAPSFSSPALYSSTGLFSYYVAARDVNGDGKIDLISTNFCAWTSNPTDCNTDGSIDVRLGNGDGTFQPVTTYDPGGYGTDGISVADVNGDGKADLLVANIRSYCPPNCSGVISTVGVLLGNVDGTFQPVVLYNSGGLYAHSVIVMDANRDGKLDIAVANQCVLNSTHGLCDGGMSILLGNGDGTFQPAVSYPTGGEYTFSIAAADVNLDGKQDLVLTSECAASPASCGGGMFVKGVVSVFLGNGDGTFRPAVVYDSGGQITHRVALVDVNGDKKNDIVVTNFCAASFAYCGQVGTTSAGSVSVMLGNGNGTFQPAVAYGSAGYGAFGITVLDVNGDARPDLVVSNLCISSSNCSTGTIGVLLGKGNGTFQSAAAFSSGGVSATGVKVADVDGDHKPDLVVVNECGSGSCNSGLTASVGVLINRSAAIGSVSPTSVAFPNQRVNTTSPSMRISMFNKGNYQMTISQFLITGDFQIQTNLCGNGIRPGTHCDVYVTFRPKFSGTRQGLLTFVDKATNKPLSASLTGIGVP